MINRINSRIVSEIDKLSEPETAAVLEYISEILQTRKQKQMPVSDELIGSLADAYENRRAQQVIEWERVRRQNIQRAA